MLVPNSTSLSTMKLVISRDEISLESDITRSVKRLNESINDLIISILGTARSESSISPFKYPKPLETEINQGLFSFLANYDFNDHSAIEYVVEYVVRNMIFTSIHFQFFEGKFFFGVGSRPIREYLDRLMSAMIGMGKSLKYISHQ